MEFKDEVIIKRKTEDDSDPWGEEVPREETSSACRIDYKSKLVRNKNGEEVISTVHIRFPGFKEVQYTDELMWTDLAGKIQTAKPISILTVKDLDYRPRMTVIHL